ncbi:STAS domain-containing protein [Anaeromyxobacter dehalogenans]|uniref:MlaB-like STAS domain-containing protein n=1 Tax=Anaeromyxobacter dehalogenans (strain 2CP-C) TaxID=290397 RepID=Q2IL96_ANADE|nr:STAS domain-containing protein [Anaeromyxobacter dehalogenans]ABC82429.1 hypothetical protein Adeh_2659 [Anaeromyxobacter dehalogenans 2CP-C]
MTSQEPGETHTIRRDGVFDVPAAEDVARSLASARPGTQVRVDLTHVREFHDFGVAVLARALAGCPARVSVRGLRQHHRRLLRYLGVAGPPDDAANVPA